MLRVRALIQTQRDIDSVSHGICGGKGLLGWTAALGPYCRGFDYQKDIIVSIPDRRIPKAQTAF